MVISNPIERQNFTGYFNFSSICLLYFGKNSFELQVHLIQLIQKLLSLLPVKLEYNDFFSSEIGMNPPVAGMNIYGSRDDDFTPIHTPSRQKSATPRKSSKNADNWGASAPKKTGWGNSDSEDVCKTDRWN